MEIGITMQPVTIPVEDAVPLEGLAEEEGAAGAAAQKEKESRNTKHHFHHVSASFTIVKIGTNLMCLSNMEISITRQPVTKRNKCTHF